LLAVLKSGAGVELLGIQTLVTQFRLEQVRAVGALERLEDALGIQAPLKISCRNDEVTILSSVGIDAEVAIFTVFDVISPAGDSPEKFAHLREETPAPSFQRI